MKNDLPRDELLRLASETMMQYPPEYNLQIHFKYTCLKCGERCTLTEPNILYERGECHKCGHNQPIERGGFLLKFCLT
jgi:hypothetical protein